MKTALINGSPRGKISTSFRLLKEVKTLLPQDYDFSEVQANKAELTNRQIEELKKSDIWIFANPLYIDSLPGHLLAVLEQLEAEFKQNRENTDSAKTHKVYAIINCGFYEAAQNKPAVRVYKNWCKKAGFEWCGAVAVGGGGALGFMPVEMPLNAGPTKPIYQALVKISDTIRNGDFFEPAYVSFGFPRILYLKFAPYAWRKAIKENGKKTKDIYRRPAEEK